MTVTNTMTQDGRVCMYACPFRRANPDPDHLTIEVEVCHGFVVDRPGRRITPQLHSGLKYHSRHPRSAILSTGGKELHHILANIFSHITTPFPLQCIYWAINYYPKDEEPNHTLNEIIAGRLTDTARRSAREVNATSMMIRISKLEKVNEFPTRVPCYYRCLLEEPLGDWIKENLENVEWKATNCVERILRLRGPGNRYFGVRCVKIGEEGEIACTICMEGLEKGKHEIRMPCSHIFHGFCILGWLEISLTCPLCRFKLSTNFFFGPLF